MLRSTFLLFCLLLPVLATLACKSDDAGESSQTPMEFSWQDVTLKRWRLIELNGVPISSESDVELSFDGRDRVSGHAGVNQFMGTCERDENFKLSFGAISSTKMAGSSEAMALESSFFTALAKVDSAQLVGDELRLLTGKEVTMRFHGKS